MSQNTMVTEFCAHCEEEVTLNWDIKKRGFEARCPYCGGKLMLCSECPDRDNCDWDDEIQKCHMCTEQRNDAVRKAALRTLAYERYKLDWCISHGITVAMIAERVKTYMLDISEGKSFEEYVADTGAGMDLAGGMWVCEAEFLDNEYQDPSYVQTLLSKSDEFADYLRLEGHQDYEEPSVPIEVNTPMGTIVADSKGDVDYPGINLFIRRGTTSAMYEPGCMLEYNPNKHSFTLHVYQPNESSCDDPSKSITLEFPKANGTLVFITDAGDEAKVACKVNCQTGQIYEEGGAVALPKDSVIEHIYLILEGEDVPHEVATVPPNPKDNTPWREPWYWRG